MFNKRNADEIKEYLESIDSSFRLSEDECSLICQDCGFIQKNSVKRRFTLKTILRYERFRNCRQCKAERIKSTKDRYHIFDLNSDETIYRASSIKDIAEYIGISFTAAVLLIDEHIKLKFKDTKIMVLEG